MWPEEHGCDSWDPWGQSTGWVIHVDIEMPPHDGGEENCEPSGKITEQYGH